MVMNMRHLVARKQNTPQMAAFNTRLSLTLSSNLNRHPTGTTQFLVPASIMVEGRYGPQVLAASFTLSPKRVSGWYIPILTIVNMENSPYLEISPCLGRSTI